MKLLKVSPCPWCGSKASPFNYTDAEDGEGWTAVECHNPRCKAMGPSRKSWNGAIKAWNSCKGGKGGFGTNGGNYLER